MAFRSSCMLFLVSMAISIVAETSEQITLAVNDLSAQGLKESDAVVISEQLRVELMKSSRIRLIERSQMQEILKEQGFQQSGCTSDACAVEIGQLIGVKNIIVGSVGVAGSYTVLSVRVIEVGTGRIVVNESIRTKGGIDKVLEKGIAEASGKLLTGLVPESVPQQSQSAQVRRKPLKGILIGSGVAVLVGGGAALAVILLKKDDNVPNQTNDNNTRIYLP